MPYSLKIVTNRTKKHFSKRETKLETFSLLSITSIKIEPHIDAKSVDENLLQTSTLSKIKNDVNGTNFTIRNSTLP